jgi:prepilin-type N-terminal cleavage/methylation domain-containing protein
LRHDFDAGSKAASCSFSAVHRGYSLAELAVVLAVIGFVTAFALPRWGTLLDRIAVERAASELTTALAVARNAAVLRTTRARLSIAPDSLGIDEWGDRTWLPVLRWPGPEGHGVSLEASNESVIFGANGIGLGVSNTTVVLRRGTRTAKITMSRVGRVKRW